MISREWYTPWHTPCLHPKHDIPLVCTPPHDIPLVSTPSKLSGSAKDVRQNLRNGIFACQRCATFTFIYYQNKTSKADKINVYINIYYIYRYAIYAVQSDVFIHTHKCVFDFDAAENENKSEARRRDETLNTLYIYIYRYTHSIYISNCTGSGAKWEALTHLRQEAPVQFHVICNCCDASTWALGGLHSPT